MKNFEALQILNSLKYNQQELDTLKGTEIAYKISKNIQELQKMESLVNQLITPNLTFLEYDKKRIEICEKYADKEKDGTIIKYIDQNSIECYSLDLDNEDFKAEILELYNKYSDSIELNDLKIKKYDEYLSLNCDIPFEYFTLKQLKQYNPKLSKSIIDSLYCFIK